MIVSDDLGDDLMKALEPIALLAHLHFFWVHLGRAQRFRTTVDNLPSSLLVAVRV